MRRALDSARRAAADISRAPRWLVTLVIAAGLLMSALGPPSSVRADVPPGPVDPVARLQLVLKSIRIRDDRDLFGEGEMKFSAVLCEDDAPQSCGRGSSVRIDLNFNASSGQTVILDRVMPQEGDETTGAAFWFDGIAVFPGEHYHFQANIYDDDPTSDDHLGRLVAYLDEEHGWGIGTSTARSLHNDGSPGDYDLTFEVRRTPLPDFRINGVRHFESGGREFYCASVENIGERPSSPARLVFRARGVPGSGPVVPALEPNQISEHCIVRSELPAEQHQLEVTVDEPRQISEINEANNRYEMTVPAVAPASAAPGSAPSPQPAPPESQPETKQDQPDLSVRAIKVNGQAPDGQDDCSVGSKNSVAVVIKNTGSDPTGSFSTRLIVDGNRDDAFDLNVDGLDAGQERDVIFENVQMKKGEHTLKAIVDAEDAIDESRESNNELKATARCKDAG
jgi:hypothetical protein